MDVGGFNDAWLSDLHAKAPTDTGRSAPPGPSRGLGGGWRPLRRAGEAAQAGGYRCPGGLWERPRPARRAGAGGQR